MARWNWKSAVASFDSKKNAHKPQAEPNIVDIAAGSDDFNLLVKALATTGLTDTVRDATDVTVFAPTDAAFTQLAVDLGFTGDQANEDAVFDFLVEALGTLGDPVALLTDVLLYHVSPGEKTAAEIDALDAVPTLLPGATFGSEGAELIDNEPDISNPNIAIPDIPAGNGVIQAIDKVLLPIDIPGNEAPNIVDIAAGSDDFNLLVKALATTGLTDTVRDATDVTVFAPTDAAFTQLAVDLGFTGDQANEDAVFDFLVEALGTLGDPVALLTDVLLYHVSPGEKTAAEIDALDAVPTLLPGATFGSEGAELIDNEPDISNPNIAIPDIAAGNGVIQAIDKVLLPIDIPSNDPDLKIVGSRKDDTLEGRAGDDHIFGRKGDDFIVGNDGHDVLRGNAGDDTIEGGAGDDVVRGNRGDDMLDGGEGDDRVIGGKGNDFLSGGAGDDFLKGGSGHDSFDFSALAGHDEVADLRYNDKLIFSKEDFADVHALFEAAKEVGDDIVISTEDGSVTLEHVDAHQLFHTDIDLV